MPRFDGSDDLSGNAECGVDVAVLSFRYGRLTDFQYPAVVIFRQHNGDDLMRAELIANGAPRCMNAGLQELVLDGGDEDQVYGQHLENLLLQSSLPVGDSDDGRLCAFHGT